MSDDRGKKMVEETEIEYFLDAYEHITGRKLELVNSHESPDFVCKEIGGALVGVELAWVRRDPESAQWDRIIEKKDEMDPFSVTAEIYRLLEQKEAKRQKNYGDYADKCILVLQIKEIPVCDLMPFIVKEDYGSHGFIEVWVADYSTIEAFGGIELFGLSEHNWGYHENPSFGGKPYG